MIFLDTSTVAKLYVPEAESDAVRVLLEATDAACISELARVELHGVFHRRRREGRWSHPDFLAAVRQFSRDQATGFWTCLPLDPAIMAAAAETYTTLAPNVFLRASDCLHLMTALHHGFAEIHTHDQHQTAAATVLGLKPVVIA